MFGQGEWHSDDVPVRLDLRRVLMDKRFGRPSGGHRRQWIYVMVSTPRLDVFVALVFLASAFINKSTVDTGL